MSQRQKTNSTTNVPLLPQALPHQSFPLNFHIINPASVDKILNKIIGSLPLNLENTTAYILGHPETCIAVHNYLKNDSNFAVHNLRTKQFWKTDLKKTTNG